MQKRTTQQAFIAKAIRETIGKIETLEQKIERKIGVFSPWNTQELQYIDGHPKNSCLISVSKQSFQISPDITCNILLTCELFSDTNGSSLTITMDGLGYSTWPRYIASSPHNCGKGLKHAIKEMVEEWEKHFGLDSVLPTTTRAPVSSVQ